MIDSEPAPQAPFLDWPELLARVEGDRELLLELLELFRQEFPQMRSDLLGVVEHGDFAEIQRSAHTLKGMLINLSIKKGAALTASIESAARAGDRVQICAAAAAFDKETAQILPALEAFMAGIRQ